MFNKHSLAALGLTAVALLFLVFLGVRHYGGNVSGLLHMDVPFGEAHQVPPGVVLYTDAAYDGMLYYQVARDLPALVRGEQPSLDSPYRFQRILLPALTYAVTLGNERAFPHAILVINLLCVIGSLALMLAITRRVSIHALTVVLNPAALVGVLYALTEPLSLFFMMVFFWLWQRAGRRVTVFGIVALILSLFARETTVFLIGLLFLWSVWERRWKEAALLLVPVPLFILWQFALVQIMGDVGFQANGNVVSLPFGGPLQLILWLIEGITLYRLSGIALFGFVFLLFLAVGREWAQKRTQIGVLAFLLGGLTFTMLCMDSHMWGAITSIGRVVTPIYPVYALYAAEKDTRTERALSAVLIAVSVVAAVGIASIPHPYVIS